jgi:hypothetical protein
MRTKETHLLRTTGTEGAGNAWPPPMTEGGPGYSPFCPSTPQHHVWPKMRPLQSRLPCMLSYSRFTMMDHTPERHFALHSSRI